MARPHLLVLLRSEELFDKGLSEVPHGREGKVYRRILSGDFSLQTLPLCGDDLPPDIEDAHMGPPADPAGASFARRSRSGSVGGAPSAPADASGTSGLAADAVPSESASDFDGELGSGAQRHTSRACTCGLDPSPSLAQAPFLFACFG